MVAVVGIAVLGACGDDSSSSSSDDTSVSAAAAGAPATAPAERSGRGAGSPACQERDALRSSFEELQDVNVVADGTDRLEAEAQDVRDQLQSFKSAARGELAPEIESVESAVDRVQSEVEAAGRDGVVQNAPAIAASLGGLAQASQSLLHGLDDLDCP